VYPSTKKRAKTAAGASWERYIAEVEEAVRHVLMTRSGDAKRCVTDLIDSMFTESKELYKGTDMEDKFVMFPDVHIHWNEKEAQGYIEEKYPGFTGRFIKPVGKTCAGTVYKDKPRGKWKLARGRSGPRLGPQIRHVLQLRAARCPGCAPAQSKALFSHTQPLFIYIEALCAAPPEAFAHSPSQMPLNCQVVPPSQRELHKDGGGGGGGVTRRARAARAPKAKSCAMSLGTPSTAPCTESFTGSSFMCRLRAGVGGARVQVAARRSIPIFASRRVPYVPALHVSTATATGPAAPTKGFERSKIARR